MGRTNDKRSRRYIFSVMIFSLLFSGCAGTRLSVTPEPGSLPKAFAGKCGEVVVRKMSPGPEETKFKNALNAFSVSLEKSGLFQKVYYSQPPQSPVDLVLEMHFKKAFSAHGGGEVLKAFASGLSMGLLIPAIWYDQDHDLQADLDIYMNDKKVWTLTATAHARWSGKLWSLQEAPYEIPDLDDSVNRQLLSGLNDFCAESGRGQ